MDAKLVILVLVGIILLGGWWLWRVVVWVWLRPKKMEKLLREQGLAGNPYTLLHGDTKQLFSMAKIANSKPIHLSDDIRPRVLPFYHHIIQTYGKSSFFWRGPAVRINIMEADLIKEILMNNNVFKKPTPNPLAKLLICGLSGYEDEKWSKHSKIVNPAFYMDKLKNMLPAMHLSCSEMIKEWEMLTEGLNKICELDVQPYMEALTSDVISRTSFGSNYQEGRQIFELQSHQAQLTNQVIQSSYIPGWRFLPTKTNKRLKEINNELRFLVRGIVNKREKSMDLGQADDVDDDLLGLLMKSSQREIRQNGNKNAGLTTEEIIDECKMFYFAGQKSTSNLLTWTMILLSIHPDWQARARDEVFQMFRNNKPDYDGLNHLKTVTMILHEVLRLYPPLTVFTRAIYKETKLGKMTLPPGVQLMLPILLLHHDPELWGDDAKEFKPERFSEGVAKATNNRLSFFPFSWGPRICTGKNFAMLEAKLALAMILQRFSFQLSPTYTHAPSFILTVKPQYGAHLLLRKL